MNLKKLIIQLIAAVLTTLSIAAHASDHCPDMSTIHRVAGENLWVTTLPGWKGQFISPQTGRGYSHVINYFITASWVALNNLPRSPGYITCDYAGDVDGETIRFTQENKNGTMIPTNPEMWQCNELTKYPEVQCTCTRSEPLCKFDS